MSDFNSTNLPTSFLDTTELIKYIDQELAKENGRLEDERWERQLAEECEQRELEAKLREYAITFLGEGYIITAEESSDKEILDSLFFDPWQTVERLCENTNLDKEKVQALLNYHQEIGHVESRLPSA